MSSYRNETRRKISYEKHHTNSNQVEKGRSNTGFRFSRQQSHPSSNFSRNNYAGARQHNYIRPRPPDESKWDDQRHSKYSNYRKTANYDYSSLSQEGARVRPHSKDLLNQGQDLNRNSLLEMKRSHSGSSEWERFSKKSKIEYQDTPTSSEQKTEQADVRPWLQSVEQRKSESPPPSHRKPGQKQSKSSNKTDKHKNPLDGASLYTLQKAQAVLKAQLAADSTDEALPLPYFAPFGSSKIIYMLDSEDQIQYSIKSGPPPQVTSLGDAKVTGEPKSKGRMPRSRSRSHSASSLSSSRIKASKSPNSDSSGAESRLKDHTAKTEKSVSRGKMRRESEAPGRDKMETEIKAEACSSRSLTLALSPFDRSDEKASDFEKMKFHPILQEPLPIMSKVRSRSTSSSSSSNERQDSNNISDKPTSRCHSRSGSESPTQLRASLLEQRRRKIEAERENNLQMSCHSKLDAKRNVHESNKLDTEHKDVGGLSPSSQDITNIDYSCRRKQTSRSSSSSPEPPPVIPRVHLSRFNISSSGRIPADCGSKDDAVLKTSYEGCSSATTVPSVCPMQQLPGKQFDAGAPHSQNPGLSTQNKSKFLTEVYAHSTFSRQLLPGEPEHAGALPSQQPDYSSTYSKSKTVKEEYAPSISSSQLSPEELHPTKALPNQQPDYSSTHSKSKTVKEEYIPSISSAQLSSEELHPTKALPNQQPILSMQNKSKSVIEEPGMSIKDIPVPIEPHKPLPEPRQQSSLTLLSFQSLSESTTSLPRPALSFELPTSTSVLAAFNQPTSLLTIVDNFQLSSVPLPVETNTSSTAERTSNKTPTSAELTQKEEKLFSGYKSLNNDSTTHNKKEQSFPRFHINAFNRRSSFPSSFDIKKAGVTMETAFIDNTNIKEIKQMDSQTHVKEEGADMDKEISRDITSFTCENIKQADKFKGGRFKRISSRNFPEKNHFNEEETCRPNRSSSSSSRDRRRSRNRSKSTENRSQKRPNSPVRQRSSSRRSGKSPPAGRTSSHFTGWQSPPRSSWKSHGVNHCDRSPPRKRSRSFERHRRGKRTKSRSKSRNSSRSRRLSSTSSSD